MFKSDWPHHEHEWRNSKRAILAYHVGGWREGESPLDALARALGVSTHNIQLESTDSAADELDHLSACLGEDWVDLSGLNIAESVALAISVLNEKLRVIPPEVRAFFDAPRKLEPLQTTHIFNEPRARLNCGSVRYRSEPRNR
ncbi:hypothetical protein [Methylocystis echinoides]|uniref:hypothetical protein n=1 Tax=Methylocystis echinoides TaxID=29468 RepID=UPI0034284DBB